MITEIKKEVENRQNFLWGGKFGCGWGWCGGQGRGVWKEGEGNIYSIAFIPALGMLFGGASRPSKMSWLGHKEEKSGGKDRSWKEGAKAESKGCRKLPKKKKKNRVQSPRRRRGISCLKNCNAFRLHFCNISAKIFVAMRPKIKE